MELSVLRKNLLNKFAGAAMMGIAAISPVTMMGTAHAGEAQPAQTSTEPGTTLTEEQLLQTASYTGIEILRDADRPAIKWAKENPGIAVSVYLGQESPITPDQLMSALTQDINGEGVENVSFFFEQHDAPGTALRYRYGYAAKGPFNLNTARPEARKTAQKYLWLQRNPQFSYNNED